MHARPIEPDDWEWAIEQWNERWGSVRVVSRGHLYDASTLPAFVVEHEGRLVGLTTYEVRDDECEIVTIDAFEEHIGIGTVLVEAVDDEARRRGCRRLWLVTTNDNLPALRFYQRRGFALAHVHRNALEVSRRLKPEISEIGLYDIPLRDELELERDLS
jgi:GNAT superfamily N-acetyltransferase